MLAATDTEDSDTLIIESDNCTNQFKSVAHFYKLQQVCNDLQKPIVRIWSVAGHGKGEGRHSSFSNSEDMVSHLINTHIWGIQRCWLDF